MNPCIVAVAGLTGAGKTTAVEYLGQYYGARIIYLGTAVLNWVRERGLPQTPEGEKIARHELRERHGPAAFVKSSAAEIGLLLGSGSPVLIDAVFHPQEFDELVTCAGDFRVYLVGIMASYETRCMRLARRPFRPFNKGEVLDRDEFELRKLRIGDVLAAATHTISNEGSLENYYASLITFLDRQLGPLQPSI
jgi:dephospho-CoA kinase